MTTEKSEFTVTQMSAGRKKKNVKHAVGRPRGIPQGPKSNHGKFIPSHIYRPELFVVKDRDDVEFYGRVQKFMKRNGWKRVDVEQLRERKGGKENEH